MLVLTVFLLKRAEGKRTFSEFSATNTNIDEPMGPLLPLRDNMRTGKRYHISGSGPEVTIGELIRDE